MKGVNMEKKYISMLALTKQMSEYLKDKNYAPHWSLEPGPVSEMHRKLMQIVEDGTGTLRVNAVTDFSTPYYSRELTGFSFQCPHFLEMEYIKRSDFSFRGPELDVIHQMMILSLIYWHCITKANGFDRFTFSRDLMNELEEEELIHIVDLEEEPGLVEELVEKEYQAFTPFEKSTENYRTKIAGRWVAVPLSSEDAVITATNPYTRKETSACIQYLPWIVVFSLLERKTSKFKEFDGVRYNEYKGWMPDHLLDVSPNGEGADDFSYGVLNPYSTTARDFNGDKELMGKVFRHILAKMKELAVNKNVTRLDASRIESTQRFLLADIYPGIIFLYLDMADLSWEEESLPDGRKGCVEE